MSMEISPESRAWPDSFAQFRSGQPVKNPAFPTGEACGKLTVHRAADRRGNAPFRSGPGQIQPKRSPEVLMYKPAQAEKNEMRVLVMDDDEAILGLSTQMIRRLGHEADTATEGRTAADLFREAKKAGKPYGLVILDLTVPSGPGAEETVQWIRAQDPEVPVIVSTGNVHNPVVEKHRDHGFSGVLAKPFRMAAIQEVLEKACS